MFYVREAKGTVQDVTVKVQEATKANKFGVIATIDLKEKMAEKGVEFGPECVIVEICNPVQAKKVLEADMQISTALPCRISIYDDGDKVKIATIKPTAMLALFRNPHLLHVAEAVDEVIMRIIDTACD